MGYARGTSSVHSPRRRRTGLYNEEIGQLTAHGGPARRRSTVGMVRVLVHVNVLVRRIAGEFASRHMSPYAYLPDN